MFDAPPHGTFAAPRAVTALHVLPVMSRSLQVHQQCNSRVLQHVEAQ